ncbi:uncharacterized protein LOC131952565 [Physella acuta]|uniref:uncharacterized protein LOC131952565 n=1 Tax=Physella acuta TaxID=109671 RepID=UPI0027DB27A5|nr:uncharacterized protein LOC131952565 [Physella acuta]
MRRSIVILVMVLLKQTATQILPTDCNQLEPISVNEVEFVQKKDDDFDQGITSSAARPARNPVQATVAKMYADGVRAGTIGSIVEPVSGCQNDTGSTGSTQLADVNLYVRYLTFVDWSPIDFKKCCPASQNYGCRSTNTIMPCFYYPVNGLLTWCCPLQRISIANCNCWKCGIFCKDCFYVGQCQRRYNFVKFAAVCYTKFWSTIYFFTRYLPTSCYCKQI